MLVSLGIWQARRLAWKEALIARAEAAAARPPAPLSEVFAEGDPEFRTVRVQCPGLATAPFVELRSIQDGRPGVRLISACRPSGFAFAFLVDRGFVDEAISARPPVQASQAPLVVEGQVREAPAPNPFSPAPQNGQFYARDVEAMGRALGAPEASRHMIFATRSTNPEWRALEPSAPPAAFSNNHLGYAITWFGLAAALAGVYAAFLRRRLKR